MSLCNPVYPLDVWQRSYPCALLCVSTCVSNRVRAWVSRCHLPRGILRAGLVPLTTNVHLTTRAPLPGLPWLFGSVRSAHYGGQASGWERAGLSTASHEVGQPWWPCCGPRPCPWPAWGAPSPRVARVPLVCAGGGGVSSCLQQSSCGHSESEGRAGREGAGAYVSQVGGVTGTSVYVKTHVGGGRLWMYLDTLPLRLEWPSTLGQRWTQKGAIHEPGLLVSPRVHAEGQ